jgi:hypothetical protein
MYNPSDTAHTLGTVLHMNEVYKQTILSAQVFSYPWEVTYGPDNNLWITESRVTRI